MTSARTERILYILLAVIGVISVIGMIVLLSQTQFSELILFELTAFVVSVVASLLAIIGLLTSIHQTRTVRAIARDIRKTITELKELDYSNELIKRKLTQDYNLAKDIADALQEAGIIKEGQK